MVFENDLILKKTEISKKYAKEMGIDKYLSSDGVRFEGDGNMDRFELSRLIEKLKQRVQKELEEDQCNRSISEFFTCKIREVREHGHLTSDVTEITIWNSNDEIFDIMKEGNYVRIYNVSPQNRVCYESNIVQLSASKRSKFQRVNVNQMQYKKEVIQQNYAKYIKRDYFDFHSDNLNVYSHSMEDEQQQTEQTSFEFDMIGCVLLMHGESPQERQLFMVNLMDEQKQLISITVIQNEYTWHLKSATVNAVYIVRNVKYRGYDNKLELHTACTYGRTEFVSSAQRDEHYRKCKEYVQSQEGQQLIAMMTDVVNTKILQ